VSPFQSEEFDTLAVKAGGKEKSYVVPSAGKLAAKESPENADDFARNWHDRVLRMYAVDLLGKGEVPPGGEPNVELRVDYARGTRSVGWLEMGRSGSDVYARSENTAGWVKVATGADSMLREAPRVAGGETKEEPKGDAKKSEKKAEAKTK